MLLVNLVQQIFIPRALSQFEVLLTVILTLAGMQMIFLYIIGSYLAKDCMENKKTGVYCAGARVATGLFDMRMSEETSTRKTWES